MKIKYRAVELIFTISVLQCLQTILTLTQMDTHTLITTTTLDWVQSFVIKHNLCPFAKAPVNKGTLRIAVCDHTKKASALEVLMAEIHFLE